MLKNISPLISPKLLQVLSSMGHGDEIVLSDAHFPAHSTNTEVIRADGLLITHLLRDILTLFELDTYADPLIMMQPVPQDVLDDSIEKKYLDIVSKICTNISSIPKIIHIDRFSFYKRAQMASAIVITGELSKYSNIILKKGIITY